MIFKITLLPAITLNFNNDREGNDLLKAQADLFDQAAFIIKVASYIKAVNNFPNQDVLRQIHAHFDPDFYEITTNRRNKNMMSYRIANLIIYVENDVTK